MTTLMRVLTSFVVALPVFVALAPMHQVASASPVRACGTDYSDWTGTFRGYTGYNTGEFGGEYTVSLHNNDNSAHQTYRNLIDGSEQARPRHWADFFAGYPFVRIARSGGQENRDLVSPVCSPGSSRVMSATVKDRNFAVSRSLGICGSHAEDYAEQNFVGFVHSPGGKTERLSAFFSDAGNVQLALAGKETTVPVTFGTQRVASGRPLPDDPYREVARLDWTAWNSPFVSVKASCPEGRTAPTRLDGIVYGNGETFELVAGTPASVSRP